MKTPGSALLTVLFLTGALAGCAGQTKPTTAADAMRGHATVAQDAADSRNELAGNWDRGQQLTESGEKKVRDGEKKVRVGEKKVRDSEKKVAKAEEELRKAQDLVAEGTREMTEGAALLQESERRFNEAHPGVDLSGNQ
jgi:uncharacterized membrane protein